MVKELLDFQNDILILIYKYLGKEFTKISMLSVKSHNTFDHIKNMVVRDMIIGKGLKVTIKDAYHVYKDIVKYSPSLFQIRKKRPLNYKRFIKKITKIDSKITVMFCLINGGKYLTNQRRNILQWVITKNHADILQWLIDNDHDHNVISLIYDICNNTTGILYNVVKHKYTDLMVKLLEYNVIDVNKIISLLSRDCNSINYCNWCITCDISIEYYEIFMLYLLDNLKPADYVNILTRSFHDTTDLERFNMFIKYFPICKFESDICNYGSKIIKSLFNKIVHMHIDKTIHIFSILDPIIRLNIAYLYKLIYDNNNYVNRMFILLQLGYINTDFVDMAENKHDAICQVMTMPKADLGSLLSKSTIKEIINNVELNMYAVNGNYIGYIIFIIQNGSKLYSHPCVIQVALATYDIVQYKLLLKFGFDFKQVSRVLLRNVVKKGKLEILIFLLNNGADLTLLDGEVFDIRPTENNIEMIKWLLNYANIKVIEYVG